MLPEGAPLSAEASAIWKRRLNATPEEVRLSLEGIRAWAAAQVCEDLVGTLELVLAEVLNNVVEHAHAGMMAGEIDLRVMPERGGFRCIVIDQGGPMPGGTLPPGRMPRSTVPLALLPEGGFGWAIVRRLSGALSYQRSGGRNRLELLVPATCCCNRD
jgi:serine/threonine-protein kinase RsbW